MGWSNRVEMLFCQLVGILSMSNPDSFLNLLCMAVSTWSEV